MIDAGYFRKKFKEHASQTGAKVRAEIHLRSGAIYDIESLREIDDGYVVLRVYPARSRDLHLGEDRSRQMDLREAPAAMDRVVIPYESIACIHLFPIAEDSARSVGFRSGSASVGD